MFNKSNMKCLIFPGATSSSVKSASGSLGLGGHEHKLLHQSFLQSPHTLHHHLSSSSDNGNQLSQEEIMWEAPQLMHHPNASGPSASHQLDSPHRRNNSAGEALDVSLLGPQFHTSGEGEGNAPSLAAAMLLPPTPASNMLGFNSPAAGMFPVTANCATDFEANSDDFNPILGAPRVPLRRPISCSPGTRGKGSRPGMRSSGVAMTSYPQSSISPLAFNQHQQQQFIRGGGPSSVSSGDPQMLTEEALCYGLQQAHIAQLQMQMNAMTQGDGNVRMYFQQPNYSLSPVPKNDSSQRPDLEHQMESLSNFGDNCSTKSRGSKKRSSSGGGGSSRNRSSKRNGAHVAGSSRRSNSGRHHGSNAGVALNKSHRRIGGSMSSVSTRSHRSKRRDPNSRSGEKRPSRKDPMATFNILSSPMSPNSNGDEEDDENDASCDCSCARRVSELEKKLESFRMAVLEEMQYSLEYNNARWAKFDKRFLKELRNLRDFFEFRFETARLECEQRLQAKAVAEKEVFMMELQSAEDRIKSETVQLIQASHMATRLSNRSANRRLSLPEVESLFRKDSEGFEVPRASTSHSNHAGSSTHSYEARTPLSSDGGGGGGAFTRDSGIFDASQSSNASNPNCSSSDVSSPLSSSTQNASTHHHPYLSSYCSSNVAGNQSDKRRSSQRHNYLPAMGEPANIQPQTRLNFIALGARPVDAVTDSEVENELTLKTVPVMKCLPSERLKLQEKSAAKRISPKTNEFSGLTIEADVGNGRSAFQQQPSQLHSPDISRMGRKHVQSSGSSVASPIKQPSEFAAQTKHRHQMRRESSDANQSQSSHSNQDAMMSMPLNKPTFSTVSHAGSPNSPSQSVKEKRSSNTMNNSSS